jgi:hypothetical protein
MLFCNKRGHTFSFLCSNESRNWFCTMVVYVWSPMSQICRSANIIYTSFILIQKNTPFYPLKYPNFLCYPLTFHLLPFGLTLESKAKKMSFWLVFFEYGSRMHFKSIQYTVIEKSSNPFLTHVQFVKNKLHWNHKKMLCV